MKLVLLRLRPGDDLRSALEVWMAQQEKQAGCVISAVGSLSVAQLSLAGTAESTKLAGDLEILNLFRWRPPAYRVRRCQRRGAAGAAGGVAVQASAGFSHGLRRAAHPSAARPEPLAGLGT